MITDLERPETCCHCCSRSNVLTLDMLIYCKGICWWEPGVQRSRAGSQKGSYAPNTNAHRDRQEEEKNNLRHNCGHDIHLSLDKHIFSKIKLSTSETLSINLDYVRAPGITEVNRVHLHWSCRSFEFWQHRMKSTLSSSIAWSGILWWSQDKAQQSHFPFLESVPFSPIYFLATGHKPWVGWEVEQPLIQAGLA